MSNEIASVACSVLLWKLDTQKEWRNMSWCVWDERAEKDSAGFMNRKRKQMSGFLTKLEKEETVRHCQSKEASILWSHHQETKESPGERDNARNNAR